MSQIDYEPRVRELEDINMDFIVNVNGTVGNIGPFNLLPVINSINTAIYILQKEGSTRHTANITMLTNKLLENIKEIKYRVNRFEVFCLLYYIQQNMEIITININANEYPTWSIREDIFKDLTID
jgi:hypothetical protein